MLKAIRDTVADGAANLVFLYPSLEREFIALGKLLNKSALFHKLYRRSVDSLTEKHKLNGSQFRKLVIGATELAMDISEFTTKGFYFSSIPYEPTTTQFILSQLKEGDTFVDIGASHGYYALIAASRVGVLGKVFAFEPNPKVNLQLKQHVALNGFGDRVSIFNLALSDKSGEEVDFFVSNCSDNSGLSSLLLHENALERGHLSADNKILIRTKTFDEWREVASITRIDLVKIDVEGAEALVLRGMLKTLAAAPPRKIICETKCDSPAHGILLSYGYNATPLEINDGSWGNILYMQSDEVPTVGSQVVENGCAKLENRNLKNPTTGKLKMVVENVFASVAIFGVRLLRPVVDACPHLYTIARVPTASTQPSRDLRRQDLGTSTVQASAM